MIDMSQIYGKLGFPGGNIPSENNPQGTMEKKPLSISETLQQQPRPSLIQPPEPSLQTEDQQNTQLKKGGKVNWMQKNKLTRKLKNFRKN